MEHITAKYKKTWLIGTRVARELAAFSLGDRLPTIQDFTERLGSSRGIVQKALDELQRKGGIDLEKRGKMGTYLTAQNREILFREAGLEYLTATMPSPLSDDLASLASGICEAMGGCPVPFNFAFTQSSETRALALCREIYDFAITSLAAARRLCAKYPALAIMAVLEGCAYSPPFVLCYNRSSGGTIASGDRIAADPRAVDQFLLTERLCAGKNAVIVERPYLTCRALFLSGKVDFMVYRYEQWVRDAGITVTPIEAGGAADYLVPAALINKNNYNIANILKPYLDFRLIAEGQAAVLEHRREPVVF